MRRTLRQFRVFLETNPYMAGASARFSRRARLAIFLYRLSLRILAQWARDKCPQQAAALAFQTALSLVPLTAIVFSLLRAFGSLEQYESQWPINYVRSGLPPYHFLIAESEQVNPPILKTNQTFVDDSRTRGNRAELTVFAGRTHYSNIRKFHEPGDQVFATALAFVKESPR